MQPTVVVITLLSYFALLLIISWAATRGKAGNSSFFSGGRKAPWPLVAIATVGAAISGVTFVSVPGMVGAKGYSYLQMTLGFIAGYVVIAWVLLPLFYRLRLVSIYGYLKDRFGMKTYKTGAWFFFLSKMSGAAVRFFVVCLVLQTLVFEPLRLPFEVAVVASILLIWVVTARGGVTSVIWVDVLRSLCLVLSVILCIFFIAKSLGLSLGDLPQVIMDHRTSKAWFFDEPASPLWFGKQFLAGMFMVIAMTGLDQDMMQRSLACADASSSRKNMIVGGVVQSFVIAAFLLLGTMLYVFVERTPGMELPAKSDELFSLVATHPQMPIIVGIMFIVGLAAAAYSAAASALTALTTSFTIDILGNDPESVSLRRRNFIHKAMSVVMGLFIIVFYYISNQDAISMVYTLASYTYGPLLGLFAYGLFAKRMVRDRYVPVICIAAPLLSWLIQWALLRFAAYETGFELLLINAALTMVGLAAASTKETVKPQPTETPQDNA